MDIFQSDLGLFQENSKTIDGIRLNTDRPYMYLTKNSDCSFDYKPITGLHEEEESPISCRDFEDTTNSLKRESISSSSLSSLCTTLSSNNVTKDLKESADNHTTNTTSMKSIHNMTQEKDLTIPSASCMSSFKTEHQRKTRKKWKKTEDLALMEMLLQYSYLLTFVEYFKPMKKFWIKISHVLKQHHGFERNARQCHDRFKVLYFKAMKVNERSLGANPDITKTLFLQTKNTFTFCNGNITLKSPPAPLKSVSDTSSPESQGMIQHNNNNNRTLRNFNDYKINHIPNAHLPFNSQNSFIEMSQEPMSSANQYIFNGMVNLQAQIDVLRNQLQASERKNKELSNMVQEFLQMNTLPHPESGFKDSN